MVCGEEVVVVVCGEEEVVVVVSCDVRVWRRRERVCA